MGLDFTSFAVLTALTSGIIQAIKRANFITEAYLPLLALVVGFALSGVASFFSFSNLTVIEGIAVGLASCGLFDNLKGGKKILVGNKK